MRAGFLARCALALFLTAEPIVASAADLFFCEEREAVGYQLEGREPERVRFIGIRFTLYMEAPTLALTIDGGRAWRLVCQAPWAATQALLSCSDGQRLLLFEPGSGRFALSRIGGLWFQEPPAQGLSREPLMVSWGLCER